MRSRVSLFFVFLLPFLLILSCSYSQNLIDPEGKTVTCSAYGWGLVGGPMGLSILHDCINSYKQMGYLEVEKVGVPGIYLKEGNPPSILRVQEGYPAKKVGMQSGDKIKSVNGQKVSCIKDVYILSFCEAGETINIEVDRGGEMKKFAITTVPKVSPKN